jgi:hypothetical protein
MKNVVFPLLLVILLLLVNLTYHSYMIQIVTLNSIYLRPDVWYSGLVSQSQQ